MARVMRPAAEWIARAIGRRRGVSGAVELPASVTVRSLTSLAREVMGDDLAIYPSADMLIWDIARHEGYDIPSYPMAGCGEFREFLSDYGVSDVPGWYRRVGVTREQYGELWRYSCVVARNEAFWRKVFVVPRSDLDDANALAGWLVEVISFCLGDDDGESDAHLFRC